MAPTTAHPPLDGVDAVQAWEDFLRAAVARYGPGGSYWATVYRQQYGANAKPLPIQSWQIWNEPNLKKYFAPRPSVEEYARLLGISHDAIKKEDPEAQVVLAGMPGYGDRNAWDFLDRLYSLPGIRNSFDAVAVHPYAPDVDQLRLGVEKVREVIKDNGDQSTPMWITEIGWGSAPPDRFGLNKGLDGQETAALRLLQADPAQAQGLERAARVLVRLARPGKPRRGQLQLLRQRRAAEERPHPEARLPRFQALRRHSLKRPFCGRLCGDGLRCPEDGGST